jgi:calcineurin-like phosphoesterase family protein
MTVYFTSDQHFGHAAARGFYGRPFASTADMDDQMIAHWNSVVSPIDELWHLGDFAVRQPPERISDLLERLHGHKHLVAGNNDSSAVRESSGWLSVQDYAEVNIDNVRLVLCHYPFRSWRDMAKGSINLHGHSHGRLKPMPRQFDVGVDARGFRPVTLEELLGAQVRRAQSDR